MAVPCGDQRDWDFATHFGLEIKNIFEDKDISEAAYAEKEGKIANSDFLSGLSIKEAMTKAIAAIEEKGIGKGKTNYRLRDAVFSRQRYWGEPFPVYYKNGIPTMIDVKYLPVILPEVEKYLPTEDGQPPLGNATDWAWDETKNEVVSNSLINNETIFPIELNTMPGWAGSSWYFLRYMDPQNTEEFAAKEKINYWKNVDLYIGGSEHATGHLLYARFWTKFLYDLGYISFDEPFQKMINQGMILGRSSFVYRVAGYYYYGTTDVDGLNAVMDPTVKSFNGKPIFKGEIFISKAVKDVLSKHNSTPELLTVEEKELVGKILQQKEDLVDKLGIMDVKLNEETIPLHVDISLIDNDKLDIEGFKNHPLYAKDYSDAEFILEDDGTYICGSEIEKMSKSKYNVQTPDELVEKFGADTLDRKSVV